MCDLPSAFRTGRPAIEGKNMNSTINGIVENAQDLCIDLHKWLDDNTPAFIFENRYPFPGIDNSGIITRAEMLAASFPCNSTLAAKILECCEEIREAEKQGELFLICKAVENFKYAVALCITNLKSPLVFNCTFVRILDPAADEFCKNLTARARALECLADSEKCSFAKKERSPEYAMFTSLRGIYYEIQKRIGMLFDEFNSSHIKNRLLRDLTTFLDENINVIVQSKEFLSQLKLRCGRNTIASFYECTLALIDYLSSSDYASILIVNDRKKQDDESGTCSYEILKIPNNIISKKNSNMYRLLVDIAALSPNEAVVHIDKRHGKNPKTTLNNLKKRLRSNKNPVSKDILSSLILTNTKPPKIFSKAKLIMPK
jgi:hypothetical protein